MKLLVTGGAGFIGSNFVRYWHENYTTDRIINLDKLTYASSLSNLDGVTDLITHNFIEGDICNSELVDALVKDVDIIVHFAAESHVDNSISNSAPFIQTNVIGTHVLLEAARKYNKRFHHVSTDEVFGSLELGNTLKFNENTPYDPRSPYSASKASSDHLVRSYYHTYGLPITISNCSNNYGPRQHQEKLIPKIISNILHNKKIPIYGDGNNVRNWIYVIDHCKAIECIINNGSIGETYLIGSDTELSNLTLTRKILSYFDDKDDGCIEFIPDRLGHDRRYAIDYSKITKSLNWFPLFDIDTGLDHTVEWYKKYFA